MRWILKFINFIYALQNRWQTIHAKCGKNNERKRNAVLDWTKWTRFVFFFLLCGEYYSIARSVCVCESEPTNAASLLATTARKTMRWHLFWAWFAGECAKKRELTLMCSVCMQEMKYDWVDFLEMLKARTRFVSLRLLLPLVMCIWLVFVISSFALTILPLASEIESTDKKRYHCIAQCRQATDAIYCFFFLFISRHRVIRARCF